MVRDASETGKTVVKHPAKFNADVLVEIAKQLGKHCDGRRVLDPFGGVGGAFELEALGYEVTCLEIEKEWVGDHPRHIHTDCIEYMALNDTPRFDAIVTSPTYGNRMADHHDAKDGSTRITYKHLLGRDLSPSNTGKMHWGEDYRKLHLTAWGLTRWLLVEGGVFVLNIKDHVRDGKVVPVSEWHADALVDLGFEPIEARKVEVRGMRYGANQELRVDHEWVYTFSWGGL